MCQYVVYGARLMVLRVPNPAGGKATQRGREAGACKPLCVCLQWGGGRGCVKENQM